MIIGNEMLGLVVRKLVKLPFNVLGVIYDLLEKLTGEACQEWLAELKKFLRKEKCWVNTLLEFVGTVDVPATTSNLLVCDHIANLRKKGVKIFTGNNFESWFFGKKMKPTSKSELRRHKLLRGSVDNPIIAKLGGKEKAETAIEELLALVEAQANGKKGALSLNVANIFYISEPEFAGELRAVDCGWSGGEWYLVAREFDGPFGWSAGDLVFSRNSSETKS